MGVIDAGPEAGRDENGRVVLVHDGRAGERHAGDEAGAEIGRYGGGAAVSEVDASVAGNRVPRVRGTEGGGGRGPRRRHPLRQDADPGDAEIDQLDLGVRQVVGIQPPVLRVKPADRVVGARDA